MHNTVADAVVRLSNCRNESEIGGCCWKAPDYTNFTFDGFSALSPIGIQRESRA